MRKCLIYVCLLIILITRLSAGTISGHITDTTGAPLPFCNVYLSGTTYAVPANAEGFYQLTAPNGEYVIVFQFIGYSRKEIPITISDKPLMFDVVLQEEMTELQTIVIGPDHEDPAYAVIKQAIERRADHLKEVNAYSCDVYMKGLQKLNEAPDQIMGIKLNTVFDVDSNNTGIIYLSESVSSFNYKYPDQTKEIMKASVVSGDKNQFSWNDAAGMQMNFYQNLETLQGFSQRGFVSPIADNALFFYTYHLLGNTFENNREIFKIQVTPKRSGDPAYTGVIYITNDDYRITGLDLTLTKQNGIEFLDTFNVTQEYYYADREHLMLLSNKFSFNYGMFGIQGEGYFHAYYKNYTINPIFDKHFFDGEVIRINAGANKQDSTYWAGIRPMQLTKEEQLDYHEKDSLAILKESPAYQDSMDHIFNKFSPAVLITGYNWRDSKSKSMISTNNIFDLLQFNTVENYVIQPRLTYTHWYEDNRRFEIGTTLRWNTATNGALISMQSRYLLDPVSQEKLSLLAGSRMQQFNPMGISPLVNSLYTLLLEQNSMKLYAEDFIQFDADREMYNGFYFGIGAYYGKRYRQYDAINTEPWIDDQSKYFSNNNDFVIHNATVFEWGPMSDILMLHLHIKYVIKQTYILHPDEKFINEPKYPVIELDLRSANVTLNDELDQFNKIHLSVFDRLPLSLVGNLEYIGTATVQFADYEQLIVDKIHAIGNETKVSRLQNETFYLLPYYYTTASDYMFTGHVSWHTEGFLFRKLPLFKQLKMEPVFSAHVLTSDTMPFYTEFTFGVEHLFKIIRVDLAITPMHDDFIPPARLFIGFGF